MSPLLEVRFPSAVISYAASISTSLLPAMFCIVTLPLLELRTALPVSAVTSPLVAILPLAFAVTLLSAFTMLLVVMLPPASRVMSPLLDVRFPSAVISCAASISTSLLPATFCIVTLPLLELRTALPFCAVTSPLVAMLPLAFAITLLSAFTMLLVVILPPAFRVMSPLLEVRFPSAVISYAASISTT